MFAALRLGSILYVLTKGDTPELKLGLIISVSSPNNFTPYSQNYVDIAVKVNGETLEFKQLPSALSIATYDLGNTIVSESRELMLQEVENMLRTSKLIIESIPFHENVIAAGEEMLKLLNPLFAKLKDLEDKINNLESKVVNMETKLDNIATMLSKALSK